MNERTAGRTRSIVLVFDGLTVPVEGGAQQRFLSTARLLVSLGFPVTVAHAWRGWCDTDALAGEPFDSVFFHPDDIYGSTPVLTDFLRRRGFDVAVTKTPSILTALLRRRALLPQTDLLFECHDLPEGDSEELAACLLADRTVVLSPTDLARLNGVAPGHITHLPCFVAEHEIRPCAHSDGTARIAVLGNMFHRPNADSATMLAAEVLPLVHREVPGAELHVFGPTPPALRTRLSGPGVRVHGQIADVISTLNSCDVAVSVVASGTGVRVKVLDYLAAGLPVVANELGCAGLPLLSGAMTFAAGPVGIATELVALLRDPGRRAELAREGQRLLRSAHTDTVVAKGFRAVFSAPAVRGSRRNTPALARITPGPAHWIVDMLRQGRAAAADPGVVSPGHVLEVRRSEKRGAL